MEGAAGRWSEAETILSALLEQEPTLTGAVYNLACVRAHQGRIDEAVAGLRRLYAIGWRETDQLRIDPDLASVRASGKIDDLLASDQLSCKTW